MIDDELLAKFDRIQDLPVSEEMLGIYLEGNLSTAEEKEVSALIYDNPTINSLVSDCEGFSLDSNDIYHSSFEEFELPHIIDNSFYMPETMELEDLGHSIPVGDANCIDIANKQYGLEPLNIDFDPDTYQWEQDTCAIRSQEIVLRSFGTFVPQEELVRLAEQNGWYTPGNGTPMEHVGNLLDLYNIPNHRIADANVFNLVDELGQGHKVIVGVDVDELYGNSFWQSIKEHLVGKTPNHAMIVSGLNTSDPDCIKVTLTDPGTGKTLFECPYEKFLSAWNDSECFMVATDHPAPLQYNPESMINFDYQKGHVASLGKMPFEQFHDEIVPNAEDYLESVDRYIESLELNLATDFKSLDLYEDMMNKADIAHQKAINLHIQNVQSRSLGSGLQPNLHNRLGENPDDIEHKTLVSNRHSPDPEPEGVDSDDGDDNDMIDEI